MVIIPLIGFLTFLYDLFDLFHMVDLFHILDLFDTCFSIHAIYEFLGDGVSAVCRLAFHNRGSGASRGLTEVLLRYYIVALMDRNRQECN